MRLTTRSTLLSGLLAALLAAGPVIAAFDANTANFKDMLIDDGNGRGDRDGGPMVGAARQPDGIPDVFQGWMAMYEIQSLSNSAVSTAWNGVYADINARMTPFVAFPELGALYCGLDAGGRQYWVSFAAAYGFTVPTDTMPTGSLGRYGAPDDPDGDGLTNLQEFQWAAQQYGLNSDPSVWSDADWKTAYETNHSKGTGMRSPYVINDVMSLFASAAVPEPATLGLFGLSLWTLVLRRRPAAGLQN